ncbi:hypothetical protein [Actinoallomurus acaciae]|uniref:Uncharacterized protein n=1 Tax=Actinoallomurus acaciae TaxID=502577 RepID=A0ABV5YCT2_9ACTN
MPYTITCRYHEGDNTVRDPRQWEDFGDAARQRATFAEEMARSLSPPLDEAEKSSVQAFVALHR